MRYKAATLTLSLVLFGCSGQEALDVTRGLLGYIPPPENTTISEELRLEYQRCLKIGVSKKCAQDAYDVVRKVKGLEPRKVPEGIVIILEGDGGHSSEEESEGKDDKK